MTPRIVTTSARRKVALWLAASVLLGGGTLAACARQEAQQTSVKSVPAGTYDPAEWGKRYPVEYQSWLSTKNTRAQGSKYKRGGERGGQYDKLSEYPFLASLSQGIGFSVEFNEPRGHYWALIDQNDIDPARLKAGGVCLACKTPYWDKIRQEQGAKIYPMAYTDAVNLIPAEHRKLGPACIDCHRPEDASLETSRDIIQAGLKALNHTDLTTSEKQTVVCGQCHSTYVIPKTAPPDPKSKGLFLPWQNSTWGDISVEDIISVILSKPENREWTQTTTGFRLGYIRHPEFELYTRSSVHWRNGVSCADCHMPMKVQGDVKYADHNIQSPLDDNMSACRQCHTQSQDQLQQMVIDVQDRMVGLILNAGYATTADAQLFRIANAQVATQSAEFKPLYDEARAAYEQAFYRVAFVSAENSVGFHNPSEAERIAGDALAYANRATAILREILGRANVPVPAEVNLQLLAALENRGERKLNFDPKLEFRDPSGVAETLWANNLAALRGKAADFSTPTAGTSATSGASPSTGTATTTP